MPARNKRAKKEQELLREKPVRASELQPGGTPTISAPAQIVRKTLQDALIDGYENPAQFARDFLDLDPYPAQETFLVKSRDAAEANFVAGNRVGKSWVGGVELLWRGFYRYISPFTAPDRASPHVSYKAVSTSLTLDQAKLAWNYAVTFAESKRFRPFVTDTIYNPFPTMTLRTRNEEGDWVLSEVWARSLAKGGLYLLGHSISFVLVDECAYIKGYPVIEDEVLRMRLADQGGALFRISTPNGRNHFFNYYQGGLTGDPRYYSQRVTTWDNPYISRPFIAEMKERMLAEYYAQNVMAEFVSLSDFFKLESIQALYEEQDYSLPLEPEAGATYVMGVDLGAMRDPTVVIVWRVDKQPAETVFVGEVRNANWRTSREFAANTYGTYRPVVTLVDATGVGAPIAQQLIDEDGLTGVEQFVFSAASKPEIMVRLQDAVQRKKFVFPYVQQTKEMINQLSFYRLDDKNIAQDYPIALALVNLARERYEARHSMRTELYDDLRAVDVLQGGLAVGGVDPDLMGNGTLFEHDWRTGLFIPVGSMSGERFW